MTATPPPSLRLASLVALAAATCLVCLDTFAGPAADTYWNVDDVRPGMKGTGRTVMKGTKIESFDAEVLGVLKNTSPGRDMILCRLSGLDLERTGVIAGMSGSPIHIDGKLLGAVAFAWPFGKDPIAGITPFSQMHGFVEDYERRDRAAPAAAIRLPKPLTVEGRAYDRVTVASTHEDISISSCDNLTMVPLRTPVAATGFSTRSLALLKDCFHEAGLVAMQGGGATREDKERDAKLEPGGPLAVALILGDFDMSGIGTVTHIEGDRVYGWGHPFFGIGACDFPLMTGVIHTVYPRQTVSFKMGSPLKTVGVINADVSTCVAGWLGREPDLMPVRMTVRREAAVESKTFNVKVVRQKQMVASLVYAALTNAIDQQGELPQELTAELSARIDIAGHAPIVIENTMSGAGYSGAMAPMMMYHQIASAIAQLTYNSFTPVRVEGVECATTITSGRRSADIESVELSSETFAPGETLRATVQVRPYKGVPQRVPISLRLPFDLPEGSYHATICDAGTAADAELRDNPTLKNPVSLEQLCESLRVQTRGKYTSLVVRVPVRAAGVAVNGKALPNLPPSMVRVLGDTRRTGAQTMAGALVSREPTDWVMQGSTTVSFTVTKHKKVGLMPLE